MHSEELVTEFDEQAEVEHKMIACRSAHTAYSFCSDRFWRQTNVLFPYPERYYINYGRTSTHADRTQFPIKSPLITTVETLKCLTLTCFTYILLIYCCADVIS